MSTTQDNVLVLHDVPPLQVLVDAKALHRVLHALSGPGYCIRELQATRGFALGDPNPIDVLADQYNAAMRAHNALHAP